MPPRMGLLEGALVLPDSSYRYTVRYFRKSWVISGITSGRSCNTSVASLGLNGVLHTGCCLQEVCWDLQ